MLVFILSLVFFMILAVVPFASDELNKLQNQKI